MPAFSRAVIVTAALLTGCGGEQPSARSPTVTGDSPEFRKAAENAERIDKENKEAERKALGGKQVE